MKSESNPILNNLHVFVAFARKRLGDAHLAEDVVQDSLLKAMKSDKAPETDKELVVWFYRILRRSIIDIYRKQKRHDRSQNFEIEDLPDTPTTADRRSLCQCFKRLLPELPEQYRQLLQRIDLEGETPSELSAETGLSLNSLNVKLHRARKSLRDKLVATCKVCSKHGCIDCTCC